MQRMVATIYKFCVIPLQPMVAIMIVLCRNHAKDGQYHQWFVQKACKGWLLPQLSVVLLPCKGWLLPFRLCKRQLLSALFCIETMQRMVATIDMCCVVSMQRMVELFCVETKQKLVAIRIGFLQKPCRFLLYLCVEIMQRILMLTLFFTFVETLQMVHP